MKKGTFLALIVIFFTLCTNYAQEIQHNNPTYDNHHQEKSRFWDIASKISPPVTLVVGIGYLIYSWFQGPEKKEPSEKWRSHDWEKYLKEVFKNQDESTYLKNVIHHLDGYYYHGFCSLITNMTCDDSFFNPLKQFVEQDNFFGDLEHNNVQLFFNKLPYGKQQTFLSNIREIIYDREKKARINQEREYQKELAKKAELKKKKQEQYQKELSDRLAEQDHLLFEAEWYSCQQCIRPGIFELPTRPYCQAISKKEYYLSNAANSVIKEYNLPLKKYRKNVGIEIQHILHKECIEVLEQVACDKVKPIKDMIIAFVETGRDHNQAGMILDALRAVNLCWLIIYRCTKAATLGGIQGACQIADVIVDLAIAPEEVLDEWAEGIEKTARIIFNFINRHRPNFIWEKPDLDQPTLAQEVCWLSRCLFQYTKDHPYEAIQEACAMASQGFIINQSLLRLSAFFNSTYEKIPAYLEKIAQKAQILTAEEIPVAIAAKTGELLFAAEKQGNKALRSIEKIKNTIPIPPPPIIKVSNMREFFELDFGKLLKGKVTKVKNQLYKVTENIENTYLRQGDQFYLDRLHFDHIEVFDKNGRAQLVLNLNGSVNLNKTEIALKQRRTIEF